MAFEGFELSQVDVGETDLRVRHGGSGPPLILLHGYPQTHMMWGRVADDLARDFTVIAPDLRGYGKSGKPQTTADHEPYSKSAMARDIVALGRHFGFDRFNLAGHDRGARVAYRLALDHPQAVEKLCVLDVVPTNEMYETADAKFALSTWTWFFLPQPAPLPERTLGADPDWSIWRDGAMGAGFMQPDAMADYMEATRDPATLHAMCEDYRAGVSIDWPRDAADKGKVKITAPLLALWGQRGAVASRFDVLEVWRAWADDVRGFAIADCGHFIPEEQPAETVKALRAFFAPG
ncbi:MAG: alpha/beta hydrolase [Phenylobacterium sp.]|uniref:alpha/beta fold hydrolase n=1 Tax=Phenylobacterium sp. TaxID=1871053 RepID=UPI0027334A95|nr:alpha/beta hydrolase [Phenylobacterium sp.]MDP3174135.1 alpha/beta hydrolase [Phenylobacterium sp.]